MEVGTQHLRALLDRLPIMRVEGQPDPQANAGMSCELENVRQRRIDRRLEPRRLEKRLSVGDRPLQEEIVDSDALQFVDELLPIRGRAADLCVSQLEKGTREAIASGSRRGGYYQESYSTAQQQTGLPHRVN